MSLPANVQTSLSSMGRRHDDVGDQLVDAGQLVKYQLLATHKLVLPSAPLAASFGPRRDSPDASVLRAGDRPLSDSSCGEVSPWELPSWHRRRLMRR